MVALEKNHKDAFPHIVALETQNLTCSSLYEQKCKKFFTVWGSASGKSISAHRRNTLPLQARHNSRSNAGNLCLRITPAMNLKIKYSKPSDLLCKTRLTLNWLRLVLFLVRRQRLTAPARQPIRDRNPAARENGPAGWYVWPIKIAQCRFENLSRIFCFRHFVEK